MDSELVEMRRKLGELGRRITQREQELKQLGVFSDTHAAYIRSIKEAHARLAGQVTETPRLHWLGVRDEFVRDYNSLVDDLEHLTESLDEQQMKSPRY